jgi:hypothetical protein
VKHLRLRLTYANVMSSIAVFLVLGGAAVAAVNLPGNSVGTRQLKKNAVKTGKVSFEAIRAGKLSKDAVPTNRLRDNAVTGPKVNEATLGQVPDAGQLDGKSINDVAMWAFVDSNGGLFRSSGGVATARIGTGTYDVAFPRDVNACAYNATNAAADNVNPAPNEVAVAKRAGTNNVVRVRTATSAGTITNDQFMLVVTC